LFLWELAETLLQRGKLAEAEVAYREVLAVSDKVVLSDYVFPWYQLDGLIDVIRAEGKPGNAKLVEAAALAQERMARSERALSEILINQPGRPDMLYRRGCLSGRMGRWSEAAADLSKVLELRPEEHEPFARLAAVLVESGDLEAYQRLCAQINQRFGATESPEIATMMARACLLVPPGNAAELATELRLADTGIRNYKGDLFLTCYQSCKALVDYRQGRFAGATEWALKALSQPEYHCDREIIEKGQSCRVEARMVLAMSCFQSKQIDQARAELALGLEFADRNLPKIEDRNLGQHWEYWILADMLAHEARALIEGSSKSNKEVRISGPAVLHTEAP
jgi:tetratricopeptide (TPR) repeat protein